MSDPSRTVRAVALPNDSAIASLYAAARLSDAYAINLPAGSDCDIATLARLFLIAPAAWSQVLLSVRDVLVRGFGVKTSTQFERAARNRPDERISFFRIYETHAKEMILGQDDSHLDFRVSVLVRPSTASATQAAGDEVVATTLVCCHNAFGVIYLWLITPFHKLIVKSNLRRLIRRLQAAPK